MRYAKWLMVTLLAAAIPVAQAATVRPPALGAPMARGLSPIVLTVTQTVSAGQSAVAASLGAVANAGGVFANSAESESLTSQSAAALTLAASPPNGTYSSTDLAAQTIGQWFSYCCTASIATPMAAAMQAHGATLGVFDYVLEAKIAGQSGTVAITATTLVNPDGTYEFLGAQTQPNGLAAIYAVYYQGAVAQGLPATWASPQYAGQEQWALIDIPAAGNGGSPTFQAVQGQIWHTVNFLQSGGVLGQYGSYDDLQVGEVNGSQVLVNCGAVSNGACSQYAAGASVQDPNNAQGVGSVSYDPDLGLNQWVQAQVAPLIQKYNAIEAIVLYQRTLAPVFQSCTSGSGTQCAVTAVSVNQRILKKGGMFFFIAHGPAGSYQNSGQYGYLLNAEMDEYEVSSQGTATPFGTLQQAVISPTQSYNKQTGLTNGQSITADDIINPFPSGNQIYSYLDDTVNGLPMSDYVYVAPITYQ